MPPKKRARGGAVAVPISSDDTRQQRRRSLRASVGSAPTPATGKRSAYFEGDESDENEEEQPPPRKKQSQGQGRGRGEVKSTPRGRKKGVIIEDSDEYDDEGVDEEEEGESAGEDSTPPVPPPSLPQKRGRGRPPQSAASKQQSPNKTNTKRQSIKATTNGSAKSKAKAEVPEVGDGEEYEDEDGGEDDDEDDDEDEEEEGRVTFIPMPKLRDTGGVEYTDTRLHPNTLLFLGDLKANNNRKWLKMHDPEYRRSFKDWESFVSTLTERITEADETIPELPMKDVIFRIYRDIRFTKDPTPYKPHYSAAWSRTGRKGPYACYYVHVQPGGCFVGGGLWHPDAAALARLRASIDERPGRIRRVLMGEAFRRTFLPDARAKPKPKPKKGKAKGKTGGATSDDDGDGDANVDADADEKAVIAAFARANRENALKTKPKGFHPEHRDVELLKLRNYTVGTKIDDALLTSGNAQDRIMDIISSMVEFVTFLNSVVMPDPNLDSDSDSEDSDNDDNEEADEEIGDTEEE